MTTPPKDEATPRPYSLSQLGLDLCEWDVCRCIDDVPCKYHAAIDASKERVKVLEEALRYFRGFVLQKKSIPQMLERIEAALNESGNEGTVADAQTGVGLDQAPKPPVSDAGDFLVTESPQATPVGEVVDNSRGRLELEVSQYRPALERMDKYGNEWSANRAGSAVLQRQRWLRLWHIAQEALAPPVGEKEKNDRD